MNFGGKLIRVQDITSHTKQFRNKKKVLVGGCFDVFHYGHLHFLKKAKEQGDTLIVLLESDMFIQRYKQKKPVHTQLQRAELLAELGCVDVIILLNEMKHPESEYQLLVNQIKPQCIAYSKGDSIAEKKIQMAKRIDARSIEIDFITEFSSSQLISYAPVFRN